MAKAAYVAGVVLLLITACGPSATERVAAFCPSGWTDGAAELPDVGDFVDILVTDSNRVIVNKSVRLSFSELAKILDTGTARTGGFNLRVSAKSCNEAESLYRHLQTRAICDRNDCRFAREWVFPE